LKVRKPKLRELKEAVTVLFSPRFTTKFPAVPCEVPENFRGKPEIDDEHCVGCGACVNACPTEALTIADDLNASTPVRKLTHRYDPCIFCGNCERSCTTEKGIKLSDKWDLAGLDRAPMSETHDYELQICEKCGEVIGTKKHLIWLAEKLGPLAYTNPSILLAKSADMLGEKQPEKEAPPTEDASPNASDFMRILCPKCKRHVSIRL
jgi:hydrogenase-4 component H